MEKNKTDHSRRTFLKTSLLAGGGLLIHFSGLAKLALPHNDGGVPAVQWTEINGYVKISPGNIVTIIICFQMRNFCMVIKLTPDEGLLYSQHVSVNQHLTSLQVHQTYPALH